jgi:hypothetical protein
MRVSAQPGRFVCLVGRRLSPRFAGPCDLGATSGPGGVTALVAAYRRSFGRRRAKKRPSIGSLVRDRLPGAAAWPGHELDLFEAQVVTALGDKRGDHGLLVALCAREHRRLFAAVIVAPLPQADECHMKVAALSGQLVLVPLGPFLVGDPLEESLVDQPAKAVGENLPRDPEISLKLVESSQSEQSVPDDQQRPSLADHLEGARNRTVLAVVGALEHAFQDIKSVL